ncbi:protease modulator HflC, partial [Dehalococcoides mccartyi]|nr:protease modulator HflC [Dehalococcoides mccartyi]
MAKLTIPLIVIIVAALIVIPQTLFIVDETELAIVTRFGEFKRDHTLPGLQVKTPFAEQVTKFDKRLLRVDVAPASLLTSDKRNLVIDSYARY